MSENGSQVERRFNGLRMKNSERETIKSEKIRRTSSSHEKMNNSNPTSRSVNAITEDLGTAKTSPNSLYNKYLRQNQKETGKDYNLFHFSGYFDLGR